MIFSPLLVLLFGSIVKAVPSSVIETESGPVRGEILTTVLNEMKYASFRGIPYAKPPIGDLRFKPPVEIEKWSDVLDATREGSMCIQFNSTSSTVVGSEDCLYLNVFTPHTEFHESISKPVMVWIYGGAFRTGNSNASHYGPDFLLEEDVIVVSFNYRLGPLGFLNLNHDRAAGNYGLKDQNLVLRWVQKNIEKFGGNPKQVTIFGQSAGSAAVDLHILSDMSSGLFKQSISMSGSTLCLYWGIQDSAGAETQAFVLGSKLGKKTYSKDELIETLLNASAVDLINKTHQLPLLPFRPTIESDYVAKDEEKFLTQCSITKFGAGHYNKGPHMMGFTSNETVAFAGSAGNLLDMATAALNVMKLGALKVDLPFISNVAALTIEQIANLTKDTVYDIVEETSDLFFRTGIDSKQQMLNVHNDYPIYYYEFAFNSNYSAHQANGVELDGVGHEDDLPYIFYRPHVRLPLELPEIALTRKRMVKMWTNFVKYGNPTPDEEVDEIGIKWPNSGSAGQHLKIDEDLSIGNRPIDFSVKAYELAGLGKSLILNECSKNVLADPVRRIKDIFKSNQ